MPIPFFFSTTDVAAPARTIVLAGAERRKVGSESIDGAVTDAARGAARDGATRADRCGVTKAEPAARHPTATATEARMLLLLKGGRTCVPVTI